MLAHSIFRVPKRGIMKSFLLRIRAFFLPPAGTPLWLRILPYGVLGVITILLLSGGAYTWEYTNSPEFCGTSCHTMPPEYTTYLTSPHARIACVDCHIGKGFITTRITRKAGDLKHVTKTILKDYEFPIRADDLRPARETCELCHFPEKFSDDSLREIKRFMNDEANTPQSIYLILKTGGGAERQGLGRGIHWHIENEVLYYPTDDLEQDIPYVEVINPDGSKTAYIDIESGFDPETINPDQMKEMDCITCHNRITHLVSTPEDTVDQLIAQSQISSDIPEIRLKAIEVYSNIYDTTEIGLIGIEGLHNYYETVYPEYYAENQDEIDTAIQALQDAYRDSVRPEQKSDWTSHPNNIGHKDSPGCFRCHDGKHLDDEDRAIRLECNLCHSIPVVAGPNDFVSTIEISRGPEPSSHLNENWISLHHVAFDETCSNCHTTDDPGGTSNVSFCSNPACHGTVWEYSGFDAPGLREILLSQLPPELTPTPGPNIVFINYQEVIGPLLERKCGQCHGEGGIQGLNVSTYLSIMDGGVNGPVIIAGEPENSLIIFIQTGEQPHFGQLNDQELELLEKWIAEGVPEN
jgi:nitrate/TMAO reductase-like tetraheme cytochrome c subunit